MFGNKKEIIAGSDSLNVQGEKVIVNQQNGLDYMQVRQVAMDVFKSNFYDLGEKVENVIYERAEEIINKYLEQLQVTAPEAIVNTEDPDLRFVIYEAQKSNARRGDSEIANLLVELLVNRTKTKNEPLLRLVLNESLNVIPKLTMTQVDILTVIFLVRYISFVAEVPLQSYFFTLDTFIKTIPKSDMFYQHLQYAGCISISIGSVDFNTVMRKRFPLIFPSGEDMGKNLDEEYLDYYLNLKDKWDNTKLCNSSLTSVGIVIALSNLKIKTGLDINPLIWIRDN